MKRVARIFIEDNETDWVRDQLAEMGFSKNGGWGIYERGEARVTSRFIRTTWARISPRFLLDADPSHCRSRTHVQLEAETTGEAVRLYQDMRSRLQGAGIAYGMEYAKELAPYIDSKCN